MRSAFSNGEDSVTLLDSGSCAATCANSSGVKGRLSSSLGVALGPIFLFFGGGGGFFSFTGGGMVSSGAATGGGGGGEEEEGGGEVKGKGMEKRAKKQGRRKGERKCKSERARGRLTSI